ncbi:2-oxoisovalerate dehydrogenase E1 component [Gammaproteobacteria bacterium]
MNKQHAIDLYRHMLTAREVDEREKMFVAQNLSHFHVSGAGHEGLVVLAAHVSDADWLHIHYRDKALLLARGMPIQEFFRSLLARLGSHSQGRQTCGHLSAPALKVCSMVGPVGNHGLHAVGIAAAIQNNPGNPIVVCGLGDGTTQQGEILEAVAEAVRCKLPILFIIEDNKYSISTPTVGKTFFDLPSGPATEFYGLDIHRVDGSDVPATDRQLANLVDQVRTARTPRLLVAQVERLASHTNADDQAIYRSAEELAYGRAHRDPLIKFRRWLLDAGVSHEELQVLENKVRVAVQDAALQVQDESDPPPALLAKAPYPTAITRREEYRGDSSAPRLTMREAINAVLKARLAEDPRVFLHGQDIEDPKGDVFGVTKGLSTLFPGRVVNACLSESTIIGTAVGRALAGQRPVAFIQFADFLALGFNQIISELGTMYWRTVGNWQCPVIIMVTCGAYKPGLGPFHGQSMEAIMAHIPGIDVFMPSFAADAAGLLNAAFDSPRPTIFFYPKVCLNNLDRASSADVARQFVVPGTARQLTTGQDLTLVSWGNPVTHCEAVVKLLGEHGISVDLFDLRSLSPWDKPAILASAEKTGRLLVIHEDNHTCGFGAEVLASVAEAARRPVRMRRFTRPDIYIPYHYGNQLEILPSFKGSLHACAELLGYDLDWIVSDADDPPGQSTIHAVGSGPADESVDLIKLCVQVGDAIQAGEVVAEVEASKAVVEICSNVTGTVRTIMAAVGDRVPVNAPLMRVQTDATIPSRLQVITQETPGTPRLSRRPVAAHLALTPDSSSEKIEKKIYLSKPSCVLGGKTVTSEMLVIPGWSAEEIIKRTGVESRQWVTADENVVSLAIRACESLLASLDAAAPPIVAIICSTGTPRESSPSVACQVATHFHGHEKLSKDLAAFDFNAACSGFLYGLRLAHDLLRNHSAGSVLLLTAEVISPLLDRTDPATAFLFGDAASASLVTIQPLGLKSLKVNPPLILAAPDPETTLHLPFQGTGQFCRMDGIAIARSAYKAMGHAVQTALGQAQLTVDDLSALVPHPGSKRILQNVADYLNLPLSLVRTTLVDTGNTSSTSIPLALERYWDDLPTIGYIALTAFGAGFTIAATMAQLIKSNSYE